jgi:hypothetical protein
MKKLTLLFCLIAATVTQAQTKEETINWLQEKFEKYLKPADCEVKVYGVRGIEWCAFLDDPEKYDLKIQINECEIQLILNCSYNHNYAGERKLANNYRSSVTLTMPTTDLSRFDLFGPEYHAAVIRINGTVNNEYDDDNGIRQNVVRKKWNNDKALSVGNFIRIENGETNIEARIEKAIRHLATFCPKKKEAF